MQMSVNAVELGVVLAGLIALLSVAGAASAQGHRAPVTIAVPRTQAAPPKVDGVLDDQTWKSAAVFADFKRPDGKAPKGKARLLLALLPEIQKASNADPDRVYLNRGSMGGGACELLAHRADLFASAVVLCGARPRPERARVFAHVPIWIFQ